MNFLDVAGVFERDGGKIRERLEQFQVPRIEPARPDAIDQLDDTQAGVPKTNRHGNDRLRLGLGLFVNFGEEPRVFGGIGHNHRFAVLRHPAGNALTHFDAYVAQGLRGLPNRQLEIQFLFFFIEKQ